MWRRRFLYLAIGAGAVVAALIVLTTVFGVLWTIEAHKNNDSDDKEPPPRPVNLILMISDGFGPASVTFAREIHGSPYASLELDYHLVGTVRTFSNSSLITDSAAGATTYSCGLKTYNGAIAVDPSNRPCGTILEAAKRVGMATGLVVTSRITHATPAAFSAHVSSRGDEADIATQQAAAGIDVLFGGGWEYFEAPTDAPGNASLFELMRNRGYQTITTIEQLNNPDLATPVIGLFAPDHLDFEIDRNPLVQPSLAQMTTKALELLTSAARRHGNAGGFFLMVEGSRIDMAAHNNDPAGHYGDIIAYVETMAAIRQWAETEQKRNGATTLVVATSDHETGGLTLGRGNKNGTYPVYAWRPELIRGVSASAERMAAIVLSGNQSLESVLNEYAGPSAGFAWTADDIASLNTAIAAANGSFQQTTLLIGQAISYQAMIAWTTPGHTGVDVNMYCFGSGKDVSKWCGTGSKIGGNMENTDVGKTLSEIMKLTAAQKKVTEELNDRKAKRSAVHVNVPERQTLRYGIHD